MKASLNLLVLFILISKDQILNGQITPKSSSIDEIVINQQGVTMTAFHFNPHRSPSKWVSRVIGHQSIYFARNSWLEQSSEVEVNLDEWEDSARKIRSSVDIPRSSYWPNCSYEALGYVKLGHTPPFDTDYRTDGPILGTASVYNHVTNHSSLCYYRALFENWRKENLEAAPHYWAVIFYCPIRSSEQCEELRLKHIDDRNDPIKITLTMNVKNDNWNTTFDTRLFHSSRVKDVDTKSYDINLGVCLVLPYLSSDINKRMINNVILLNWIRYQIKLGFYIFIYDRNGNHFNVTSRFHEHPHIFYHDYTIHSLLSNEILTYDNTEMKKPLSLSVDSTTTRRAKQGSDKVNTLSHCRFSARTVHNIVNVLVVDFDEFLYCPVARNSSHSQRTYIHKLVNYLRYNDIEQAVFYQRILAIRSAPIKDCLFKNILNDESIFKCFSAYKFVIQGHSIKSFHLDYSCPLTGYHQACATTVPRGYDCNCNSRFIMDKCSLIHISTNDDHYAKPFVHYSHNDYYEMNNTNLEIIDVLQSSD